QIDIKKLFENGFSTGHGFLREPNGIASYSALTCIAIQSNQNDQHGGQSIPNFDYALADGVRKTFAKNYKEHLVKSLEFSLVSAGQDGAAEHVLEKVERVLNALGQKGLKPTVADEGGYVAAERALLADETLP